MKTLHSGIYKTTLGILMAVAMAASAAAANPFSGGLGGGSGTHAQADLIAEQQAVEPGKPLTVGIHIKLSEGWHVYWKNPGGPGFPVSVEWQLPPGFKAGEIQWPYPHRFELGGLVNYGYEGDVLLPVEIQTPAGLKAGETVEVSGKVSWLACKDSCIPGDATVRVSLPVAAGPATRSADAAAWFDGVRQKLPQTMGRWQISAKVSATGYVLDLKGPDVATRAKSDLYFYPADGDVIESETKQLVEVEGDTLSIRLKRAGGDKKKGLAATRLTGILVSSAPWDEAGRFNALTVDVPVTAGASKAAPAPVGAAGESGLPLILLFAFLGGLILNLMPCVFPVLSIKILGFIEQSGQDKAVVRNHGLLFGLGVVASFWALAGILLALRAGGGSLGWGFQMQEPGFVLAMILLIFGIGLNLAGVFEIGMSLTSVAGSVGVGAKGYGKSFLSGVLATLIATPCTAPFMGTALAAALSMPAWEAMLVFTALGAGMAMPYALLALFPGLLRFLPRPGAWMESFKQFMAFPMFATAAWLVWVYLTITDQMQLLRLLAALTVFAMGAWWYGRWGMMMRRPAVRWAARVGALLCVAAAVWLAHYVEPVRATGADAPVAWEPFSEKRLAELRKEGRPILVDFTASWCLTCQWNKASVLDTDSAQELYRRYKVAILLADWSRKDANTLRVLQQYGREGVPLYLVFPADPEAPPETLPNILTHSIVEDAIKKAAESHGGSTASK